jgi:hypothetical protein
MAIELSFGHEGLSAPVNTADVTSLPRMSTFPMCFQIFISGVGISTGPADEFPRTGDVRIHGTGARCSVVVKEVQRYGE